ncbi:MAG: YgiQ family radical SAM protein [Kiritimatiellia bacterium]|nr:YgiQ family radical SAM protein [Lentisphaerota bacterium]
MRSAADNPGVGALPMTRAEMVARGWSECDVILITGDAYVDHPAFGVALIGRWLEKLGYRVGLLAQPNPENPADFLTLGPPRLCWGITAGNVDSELARLTVMRKRRRDDPYSAGGRAGARPRNASIVYTGCARRACKGVPVVLGGIEASLRRLPYYDYWTDRVRRSLLFDAKADILIHGMAERALAEFLQYLRDGRDWCGLPGTASLVKDGREFPDAVPLPAYEEIADPHPAGLRRFMEMAQLVERYHLTPNGTRALVQRCGNRQMALFPPAAPLSSAELDTLYNLPFTRRPHPRYAGRRIPAWDMIKHSLTTHRGCYGACRFCALRVHQGARISSRSHANIIAEAHRLVRQPGFDGTITDLGGPSANMYASECARDFDCRRPAGACVHPGVCRNLRVNHRALTALLRDVRAVPGVRHAFIASGIRCDLALLPGGTEWLRDLLRHGHIGGRLKIAPEHMLDGVLRHMGKPPVAVYRRFVELFKTLTRTAGARVSLREYFISGHPGCTTADMEELARCLKEAGLQPEQVQDYYPAPLTISAAMFYTGLDPRTMQPLYVARSDREKARQRSLLLGRRTGRSKNAIK